MKFILSILCLVSVLAVQAQTDGWVRKDRKYKGGQQQDGYVMQGHDFYVNKAIVPLIVCEGNDAVLTVDYDGTFAYRYEWYKHGVDSPLTTNDTLIIRGVTVADRGKYFCKVIDIRTGDTKSSDMVELKIKKRPTALTEPLTRTLICWGDTVSLNASASEADKESGDTYTYSWTGSSIVGPQNMSVVKIGPRSSGTYTVTVDNEGCSATAEVFVEVYKPVVELPDYIYISEGNTLELGVDVPDGSKLIWTAEGNTFQEIDTFRYPNIRNSMEVSVKMMNEGCEAEDKCKVYVKRGRGYKGGMQDGYVMGCIEPTIISQDRSVASCEADTAELTVVAEGSTLKYVWQKFNNSTKQFEDFEPSSESHVEGLGSYKLQFKPLVLEDNGMYLCKLQNGCGEVVSDTFYLSVGGVPVFRSRLNKEWGKCANTTDSTHLNVSVVDPLNGTLKYAWYKVDTNVMPHSYKLLVDTNTYNKPYLKLLLDEKREEGIYLVSASNACGDARDSVFIPVNTPIKITKLHTGPENTITACEGYSAEFSLETEGGGDVRYYLKRITNLISRYPLEYEAVFVKGGSSNKYILDNLKKADEGWYVWEVDNGCGKDTSDIINLRIDEVPVITEVSDSIALCEGESRVLKCSATSLFSNLTYEWYKNGLPTGKKGSNYYLSNVTENDEGNYTCWVKNTCPVVESPIIKVKVKKYPVILDKPYIRASYCQGDSIEIKVQVSNVVAVDSMRWFRGNRPVWDIPGRIWGSNTQSLHIDSIVEIDGGNYTLHVYNECGQTVSEPGKLTVDLPARFTKDMSDYVDLVLCAGDHQALSVSATGTSPIRYVWTHNRTVVADGFTSTIHLNDVSVDTAGTYCCEIQNRCDGEVACAEIQVTHPDTFRFELNSVSNQICADNTEGVTAVLKGSDSTTTYTLYRKPNEFITSVSGGDIYPRGGFIEFVGLRAGTYYVDAIQRGCTYRMPGEVTVIENPVPLKYKVFISRHFCKGVHQASISLDGSEPNLMMEYYLQKLDGSTWVSYLDKIRGTGDTLSWNNIPEGTYKVVAVNSETGCRADMTGIVEVIEKDLPALYALGVLDNDSVYCANARPDVTLILGGAEAQTKYALLKNDGTMYRKGSTSTSWANVEKGVYRVQAENQWGCISEMGRQQVITQEPPRRTSITGGFVYCREQKDSATIDITSTEEGILYKVYRESPKELYVDTMGTGTNIILKVPMQEKKYYVLAQDTTSERCSIYLADTAVFRMSRLQVIGNPEEVFIPNGTKTQLHTTVTGAEGQVHYEWTPAGKLMLDEDTLGHPHTITLTERVDYRVRVKDQSGCYADTLISVIMNDGKLDIDIRKPDKVTTVDTIKACAGAGIDLYAWVNGGAGTYNYTWRDELANPVGSQQWLREYTRANSGYLHLDVKSGDITKTDSVWVEIYENPQVYAFRDTGLVCVPRGTAYQIELTGGQAGMDYILSYSPDGINDTDIDTIAQTTVSPVIFTLRDAYAHEGVYRIRAQYPHGVLTCEVWMEGEVRVRKAVEIFTVSEDRTYCEGSIPLDTIRLSGSESGVNYSLYRQGGAVLASMTGDGSPLVFTGNYGSGDYFVVAEKGLCQDEMQDTVTIVKNPLPALVNILDKGGYCGGECPEKIRISPAQNNIEYILKYRAGGAVTELETKTGINTIAFGTYCDPGEYYVTGRDLNTGCELDFPDRVRISTELVDVNVTPAVKYCDSEAGYTDTLRIYNPQDGVEYQIYTQSGSLVGSFDSVATDGLYFRGLLTAGEYEVRAVNGRCTLKLVQTVKVEKLTLPAGNRIVPEYTLCEGDGELPMAVVTTQGFSYELLKDSAGITTSLTKKWSVSEGEQIALGSYGGIGTYYVKVTDEVNGCEWRLPDEYRIYEGLKEFNITGDSLYCAADGGVVIGIDSTETNVKYVLEKKEDTGYTEVDELKGRGMAVAFKGYFPEGEYRVKAVRGCEKPMNGVLKVRVKAMPADSTKLVLVGNGCADSTVLIQLEKTEPDVNYTLWYENNRIKDTLSGNGAIVTWDISPAQVGVYQVAADKDGCITRFRDEIKIGERPFVSDLVGDTLLCANQTGQLFMDTWDQAATYKLYRNDGAEVVVGKAEGGKMVFADVPVGTFYATAARGNCVVTGDEYTIDSLAVPRLNADSWDVSECSERGKGFIHIYGMVDSLKYVLKNSSDKILLDYKGNKTDTLFENLNSDQYCLTAENERNQCYSNPLCVEVKEGVTKDSLIGDFVYCGEEAGAKLHLSGSEISMLYSINTVDGNRLEEIAYPSKDFRKPYEAGKYVFRKERTGFMGGCFETDTIEIRHYEYAPRNFRVEVEGGGASLCAEQNLQFALEDTDPAYQYILVKEPGSVAPQYLDTVAGSAARVKFDYVVNEAGYYKVYTQLLDGVCGQYGDTTLKVTAPPRPVTVQNCSYCIEPGALATADSCRIRISGLTSGVKYMSEQDTVFGPGAKTLSAMTAGEHLIMAEDLYTGCKDTVAVVQIEAHYTPHIYTVSTVCSDTGKIYLVDGNDGDSVSYYLYRNGVEIAGPLKDSDGMGIDFGEYYEPGVYKIKAVNAYGCSVWMRDSATIFEKLLRGVLSVEGRYCESGTTGVTIRYSNSNRGWDYYLTKGPWQTDTLSGTGGQLSWDRINGSQILSQGNYALWARNACREQNVGSVNVNSNPLPAVFPMSGGDEAVCEGSEIMISLTGSEQLVTYHLMYVKGGREQELETLPGTGYILDFSSYSAYGQYIIYAESDTSGCRKKMGEKTFYPGAMPEVKGIKGNDICLGVDTPPEVAISIDGTAQAGVQYILQFTGGSGVRDVDTITGSTVFQVQQDTGCYQVTAEDLNSGCRKTMEQIYCIGYPPQKPFITDCPTDTIILCKGEEYCVSIDSSELGAKYRLLKDGGVYGKSQQGTGWGFEVGCMKESGVYRVEAYVGEGECYSISDDSIVVQVNELPSLLLGKREYEYCELGAGVQIQVDYPTYPYYSYKLFSPQGDSLDMQSGHSDYSAVVFNGVYTDAGVYGLQVAGPGGCIRYDSVEVIVNKLPEPFDLYASNGDYLCVDGIVEMGLDSSELNVEYFLYKKRAGIADTLIIRKYGTGMRLPMCEVSEAGSYYVVGVNINTECRNNMLRTFELQQADSVRIYPLEGMTTGYCYTDERKGSLRLLQSQLGVSYELYRDGESLGLAQMGDGGELYWLGLDGKPCSNQPDVEDKGYIYEIKGTDTLTKCEKWMSGQIGIVEEADPSIEAYHPNYDILRCENQNVYFSVTAVGCRLNYTWTHDGVLVKDTTENFYNIEHVSNTDYGTYVCTVSNSCGSTSTPGVMLKVRDTVEMVESMADIAVCGDVGKDIILSAHILNGTNHEWYKIKDGVAEMLTDKSWYQISNVTQADTGIYVYKTWNECDGFMTDTCMIYVDKDPTIGEMEFRTDTICSGSIYTLRVNSPDTVEWYRDNEYTGVRGNTFTLDSVTVQDEGRYTVRVENACGYKSLDVAQLYVDDTIRIDALRPSEVVCENAMIDLYIMTTPSKRVEYTWEKAGVILNPDRSTNTIKVGPMTLDEPEYTYYIHYKNKCTSGQSVIRLHVSNRLEYKDPESITLCAEAGQDTFLHIQHPATLMAAYQWYYHELRTGANALKLEGETSDTLWLPKSTAATGFYYCEISEVCNPVTTNSSWYRVDTVPVLLNNLVSDTLCEGNNLELSLSATGGDIHYDWTICYKDGTVEEYPSVQTDFETTDKLVLTDLTQAYDSCRIWCHIYNYCDLNGVFSDTMLLRVEKRRTITIDPDDTLNLCIGDTLHVGVRLHDGALPWQFDYSRSGDTSVTVSGIADSLYQLPITEEGNYAIVRIADAVGCVYTDSLPFIPVESPTAAQVTLSGGGDYCYGDTVSLSLHVEGGVGPWGIQILKESGELATELIEGSYPLVVAARDTVIRFAARDSQIYYLYRKATDIGSGCGASVSADRAKVNVNVPPHIEFDENWPTNIGQCEPVNLRTLLKPSINGNLLDTGMFYVNEESLNGDNWIKEELLAGCYQIKCEYKDSYGCTVSSDEIQICVDTLPSGRLILPEVACEGVGNDLRIELEPGIQDYVVEFRETRYKKGTRLPKEKMHRENVPASKNGVYEEPISWTSLDMPDSCVIYEIVDIIDSHGCHMASLSEAVRDSLYRDTVRWHQYPEIEFETRYPADANWIVGKNRINISKGDSVDVHVQLTVGTPTWSLPGAGIRGIVATDTILRLGAGTYSMKPLDDACDRPGWDNQTLVIHEMDTGYFKGRLWLEGPYDDDNFRMFTCRKVQDSLRLPTFASLPADVDVIDWIQIELRTGNPVDSVALMGQGCRSVLVDSCLLLSNGDLVDRYTGSKLVGIRGAYGLGFNNYYMIVRHRNHLGVMTRKTVRLVNRADAASAETVDFTNVSTIYTRDGRLEFHMSSGNYRGTKVYMLSAGEVNENQFITLFDTNQVTLEDTGNTNMNRYDLLHDINFDGKVEWPGWNSTNRQADWDIIKQNRQKFMEFK